jgi:surface protein
MTILRSSSAPLSLGLGKPTRSNVVVYPKPQDWLRPSDWLPITAPASNEQKFVGLIAVFNQGSNYVALRASVSSGTYTVDWGDGSAPVTVTSNTNAQYNYSYSSLSSSTESSRGYRQAVVTVTPTTAGATFSLFGLNYRHSARSSGSTVATWLDVAISAPNATTLRLSGHDQVLLNFLEQATVVSHNTTTMSQMFRNCRELQSVPLFDTSLVTSMLDMFNGCRSLKSVPLFNTSSLTNAQVMFAGCGSLKSVPLFNTAEVTSMNRMFEGCASLVSVPPFNTIKVTNTGAMFRDCVSLEAVPLLNTASVTSMERMFQNCSSLESVPLFNTSLVTNMSDMFNSCVSLQSVPLLDTAEATSMLAMFINCVSLQSVPLFNSDKVTNMDRMFGGCTSLIEVPQLALTAISSVANNNVILTNSVTLGKAKLTGMRWTQSFSGCNMAAAQLDEMYTALAKLNPNVTNVTGSGTVVTYTVDDISAFVANRTVTITGVDPIAYNLTSVTVATVNVANKQFTVNNAATGTYVSGGVAALQDNRTITVTGNPGTTGDDPTIAENKGWLVTG